jgi:hypothetical protein
VKKEQENTNLRAQKMMRGRVEPSTKPIMVQVVPIVLHDVRQTETIP